MNQYECTQSNECPSQYNKFVISKKKCIDDCKNDDEYIYDYNNNCLSECPENKKKYEEQKLCLDECYSEQFEYNNICYSDCPENTHRIFIERNRCIERVPENYYLDINDNIYKRCYETCKNCNQYGDANNNNCNECMSNFRFINDGPHYSSKNCYKKCTYNYYFDEKEQFMCTESSECPQGYDKLIMEKNKCIDLCIIDNKYQYEYNKICLEKCPSSTKIFIDENKCLEKCEQMQFEYYNKCYKDCNLVDDGQKINCEFFTKFAPNSSFSYHDELIKTLQKSLKNGLNTRNIDNGEDYITIVGNTLYTITTTKNQKNQKNNSVTTIDLNECEEKLKQEYNISKNDSLYILKIDFLAEYVLKLEYEVYYNFSYNNLTKLNLNFCQGIKVDISIPKEIPINELDKYNQSSGLYTDICYTLTSESGTDKSLEDRRNEYKNNNMSVCEENCDFTQYNNETKKVICSCSIKTKLPLISEIKLDKKKLFSNFIDIRNIGNFKMLSCLNLLFNKNNIFKNSANYMLVILFILNIISIFNFIFHDYKRIKKYLKNKSKNKKNKNKKIFKNLTEINSKKNLPKVRINKKINNNKIKYKYKNSNILIQKKTDLKKIKREKTENIHKKNKHKKNKIINHMNKSNLHNKHNSNHYNDYEMNKLNYKNALKLDRSSFYQYYLSLLRTKHILIFSFFYHRDYNSSMIKIYMFFLTFSMNYVISAIFYSDSTMHQIYVDDGSFNITYQIPQMFYSFIISSALENILNILGLYESDIADFRK